MNQRVFDIFFSLITLCLISPLLLPIALILRFTGEHEIFLRKEGWVETEKNLDYLNLQQC